ncbi:single-stranded DNA-binding protein [Acidithiobacillus sp.]|uniref:single-stranded DNA-binding protein n=1 Tax=Acidithiobacillus sp. TaxID=1872118 RepID=UPI002606B525|nr:single-stranded DNA-binding protein [Acidithiobacillus sp.]MDD2751015.1 single-stranded DNA-binding protein [Acidithiobacillus sp.]MDD5278782.1 single-stranded DNA-binding protein [Acidithiobacillus sp.]
MSVNRVIVLGHLGRDPEMRYQPSGAAIANFSIATTETFKDREGNKQERTEWHRIVLFGRTAEIAGEYLRKGSMAYVEGRLQTRKWEDKDGQDRYTTEIIGDRMQLIGSRNSGSDRGDRENSGEDNRSHQRAPSSASHQNNRNGGAGPASTPQPPMEDWDDDIPFGVGAPVEVNTSGVLTPRLKKVKF